MAIFSVHSSASASPASTRPNSLSPSPTLPSARPPSPVRPLASTVQPAYALPNEAGAGVGASASSERAGADLLKPVGCLADDEYQRLMPSWRLRLRQVGVNQLKREMGALEWIQVSISSLNSEMVYAEPSQAELTTPRSPSGCPLQTCCRTPALDIYFVQTSLLGTHTFFMTFIPMWFWFGHGDVGRG